jgi:glycosyltransferase involved in cell wall biosynthesis
VSTISIADHSVGCEAGPSSAFNYGRRIGILVVTYNAVTTLSKVLRRIPPEVWRNVEEVVVFDDASQDATYELAVGVKTLSENTKLQVLKHSRNLGYGGNQKAGYRYFIEKGFDVVVLLHGDGQYAPEVLDRMYHDIVADKTDAVFGSRMMKDYGGPLKGGMPLYKYIGNRILTHFENRAVGTNLTEFHSGYRAYNLHALKQIDFSNMTDDFHFDTEIIIKLHHQGFRICEVPIPTFYGDEICYVNGMRYARNILRAVYRYDRTRRSIKRYPEYQEYYVPYRIKTSSHSCHDFARLAVGRGHNVLDVTLGNGVFSGELQKSGNRVTCAGATPALARGAHVERYVQWNPASGLDEVVHAVGGARFDKVLLLDVLEHLTAPECILRSVERLVKRDGQVIVSTPNVAHIIVRLMLLFGYFNYAERGILDRTHVRFFTRRTITRMLADNGYSIVSRKMTVAPLEVLIGPRWLVRVLHTALIAFTALMPGLLGYETFLVARRVPDRT